MSVEQLRNEIEEIKKQLSAPEVVGKFEKVSLEQFVKDMKDGACLIEEEKEFNELYEALLESLYEEVLVLPKRSSVDSAGHDFVLTRDIVLAPGESVHICTGIRAKIKKGWVLLLAPRSGLGSNFRLQLNNTIGVIDGDYYYTDNEGHILATITNDSNEGKILELKAGDRFIQGIFVPYGVTEDDNVTAIRKGGYGSSGLSSQKIEESESYEENEEEKYEQLTLFQMNKEIE